MGSSEKHGAGSPNGSKWYGKLFGKTKVASSDDVPKPAVKAAKDRSALKSSPHLVVNYFPSGHGLLRL